MSTPELQVLLHRLSQVITDLRDLRHTETTPLHVVVATEEHIEAIDEAVREMRRLHGVAA